MNTNLYLVACVLLFFTTSAFAARVDTAKVSINMEFIGDRIMFKPDLPELAGIPGGREPFYTYLWDFGDGHFSTAETPEHQYTKAGEYAVTLYTVNNYDNGPRPKRPTRKIAVDSTKIASQQVASIAELHFFDTDDTFKLTKNANALPGQDMVIVVGIKAKEKGSVFLLTNEKIFDPEGFRLAGQSTYYGEQVFPVEDSKSLESLWANVSNASVTRSGSPDYGLRQELDFSGNQAIDYFSELYSSYKTITGYKVDARTDAQFSLVNLEITPEMLADTNATVTITGVFIPEKGPARIHQLDVPIVTSHDPNKMSIKQSQISYRTLAKRKKLIYKVQFQNDGKGDAKNIRLEVKLPEVLDLSTIELLNLYPKCDTCLTLESTGCYYYETKGNDTLVFHFKDIALPGSKAPDVHNKDSTQGFIRFSIRPKKKLPNLAFKAQTNIFFDKNDPITTNFATGRFRKGLSPVVFAGYHHFLQNPNKWDNTQATTTPGMLFGIGLAPLAPYRKLYWQVELYANTYRTTLNVKGIKESGEMEVPIPGSDRLEMRSYDRYDQYMTSSFLQLRLVPLHGRYNFNSWVSAGIGALIETSINTSHRETRTYHIRLDPDELLVEQPYTSEKLERGRLQLQPFADLNFGRTYLGPVAGLRYIYGNKSGQAMHLYVAWRF